MNQILTVAVWATYSLTIVHGDQLILVQPVWRHGDRSPTTTFPTDPNQESAWPRGWGQLTSIGMNQHMYLGDALYQEYVVKHKFLGTSLSFNEMYVRSTSVNRTLISAYSNLIGMYYNRTKAVVDEDYPDNPRWPGQLVPFPVHTIDKHRDYVGDPLAVHCPRREWLLEVRKRTPEYIKLDKDNKDLLDNLTKICGEPMDLIKLWDVRDALFIEKLHNKSIVAGIDDAMFKRIESVDNQVELIEDGVGLTPVDGIDFSVEVPKIKGGPILWSILDHFDLKLFCEQTANADTKECTWMGKLKYHAYSAHDTTLISLMAALRAKRKIIPNGGAPSYASCLVFELWQTPRGPEIQVLYRQNYTANFEKVTKLINGCENVSGEKCPYQKMHDAAKTFYPGDPVTLCADLTSTSTDMWNTGTSTVSPTTTTSSGSRPFQSIAVLLMLLMLKLC